MAVIEGAAFARRPEVEAHIFHHRGTSASMLHVLEQILAAERRPSALLVVNPNHFLLALRFLQKRGVRVPEDLSLICSDDDPFLAFVQPAPSRYIFDASAFARRLFRLILRVIQGQVVARKDVRIIPRYERGATLAAPRADTLVP